MNLLAGLQALHATCMQLTRPAYSTAGCVGAATRTELLQWAEAAERCHLPDLRMCCLTELARWRASGGDNLALTLADAAALAQGCGKDAGTLAALLGVLAAACGPSGTSRLAAPAAAAEALQRSANIGRFECAFKGFSKLPKAVGKSKSSPWFKAAGKDWTLQLYPGGTTEGSAGHLSGAARLAAAPSATSCTRLITSPACAAVLMLPKQDGFKAKFFIALVDPSRAHDDVVDRSAETRRFGGREAYGFADFAKLEELQPRFLVGDRLMLRGTVEVL